MARDFASPAYQRIAASFAEKIETGELAPGEWLPTRQDLMDRYDVSLQVVRDALALLHTDGYVRSIPSKGTYVHRLPRLAMPMTNFENDQRREDAFVVVVRDQGREPRQEVVVETRIAGESPIPRGLDLPEGEAVIMRRRLRWVDDVPYMISDSFYPEKLVRGSALTSPADITQGARHVLRELGIPMHSHRDRIESRRARTHEIQFLDIAPGVAVLAHTRVSHTQDGTPMRVLASVLPSDRWTVTYEVAG